jgi:hypothetical protein
MEIESGADLVKKVENVSHVSSMKKLDTDVLICSDIPSPPLKKDGASLEPITPDSNKEISDFPFDLETPLSTICSPQIPSSLKTHVGDDPCSSNEHNPSTPKEGVFDPFAPGPDKFMMAPIRRKNPDESQTYVARRLNFSNPAKQEGDSKRENDAEIIIDEEMLLETVYDSLLEAIVSHQTAEKTLTPDPNSDGFMTPPNAPRLNGIAETCPDAPIKRTAKSRTPDLALCRKLEY